MASLESLCDVPALVHALCGGSLRTARELSKANRRLRSTLADYQLAPEEYAAYEAPRRREMEALFAWLIEYKPASDKPGGQTVVMARWHLQGALGWLTWRPFHTEFAMKPERSVRCNSNTAIGLANQACELLFKRSGREVLTHPDHVRWIYARRTHVDQWRTDGHDRRAVTVAALRHFRGEGLTCRGDGLRWLLAYRGLDPLSRPSPALCVTAEDVARVALDALRRRPPPLNPIELRWYANGLVSSVHISVRHEWQTPYATLRNLSRLSIAYAVYTPTAITNITQARIAREDERDVESLAATVRDMAQRAGIAEDWTDPATLWNTGSIETLYAARATPASLDDRIDEAILDLARAGGRNVVTTSCQQKRLHALYGANV